MNAFDAVMDGLEDVSTPGIQSPACIGCKRLARWGNAPYCLTKKKLILPDYPPLRCEDRESKI